MFVTRGMFNGGSCCTASEFISRTSLLLINLAGMILGTLSLFYGVTGYIGMGREESIGEVTNPFALVVGIGTLVWIVSALGVFGAACSKSFESAAERTGMRRLGSRALLVYYVLILGICSGLLYAMFLCFLFAEKANDYVESYYEVVAQIVGDKVATGEEKQLRIKEVEAFLKDNSAAGGVVCLCCIILNLLCGHCSSILMGYKYTTRRTMLVSNFMTWVLGITTTIIAFLPSTAEMGVKNSWLPDAIGSIGVITVLSSMVGFVAVWREQSMLLLIHASVLTLMGIFMLGFASYCLADSKGADALLRAEWVNIHMNYVPLCPHCNVTNTTDIGEFVDPATDEVFVDCCAQRAGLIVWNNMTMLGVSGSVLLIAMALNWFGSLYLWRKLSIQRRDEMDGAEMDGLGGGGRKRASQNVADPSDDL